VSILDNDYSILSSEVDTYYIMINNSYTMLVEDPDLIVQRADLRTKGLRGDGSGSVLQPQTKLAEINGQIVCPNKLVKEYPTFYVPTMVSAHINNNSKCLKLLCNSERKTYFEQGGMKFLGPFHEIWKSSCFEEYGFELIESIYEVGRL
jgi:hypothetical protein